MLFATTVWVVIDEKSFTCNGHRKHILAGPLLTEYLNQALTRKTLGLLKMPGHFYGKGTRDRSTKSGIRGKLYKITNYLFIS